MRPPPSISSERMPRRASWAARIVPDAPPPTIATVVERSDFVVRPVLRVCGARFAPHHMVVHAADRLARRLGEESGHNRVNHARAARPDQASADRDRANAVTRPTHAEGTR